MPGLGFELGESFRLSDRCSPEFEVVDMDYRGLNN